MFLHRNFYILILNLFYFFKSALRGLKAVPNLNFKQNCQIFAGDYRNTEHSCGNTEPTYLDFMLYYRHENGHMRTSDFHDDVINALIRLTHPTNNDKSRTFVFCSVQNISFE